MPTRTACIDNVVSVNDRTVRCRKKKDLPTPQNNEEMKMVDQPFAASEIGESMDEDLLPELSGKTWVASTLTEEFTADLDRGEPQRRHVSSSTGVDSVKFHSDMDRLCRTVSGIALLEATDRKFVHRYE